MFTTKPLSALKNVIPSIHQPLPLSNKESQKLLNVLKTSFRQNLDKEHGWVTESENAESPASKPKKSSKQHPSSSSRDSHRRPTDSHLRSILSNPLFRNGVQPNAPLTSPRDPMDVFDEAVAKGMMTRKAALGCLRAKRRSILQSSALSVNEAMEASGAGRRVLQWLRSSGEERSLEFVADKTLLADLLPFVIAEGLEEIVWVWAERIVRGDGPADPNGAVVSSLICSLVSAKSNIEDKNLDTAFAAVLRADKTWNGLPQLPRILFQPWLALSWQSTVEAWKRPLPSTPLFESFVKTADHIRKPLSIDRAHLGLHHPTTPNLEPAVRELVNFHPEAPGQLLSHSLVKRVVLMGMDAVSHLTRLGQLEEAEALLKLLQSKFPEEVFHKHRTGGVALV
ncbi:hypothetical protein CSOJ01_09896 [Colletotrichum sojae]|uniref:Uncharacterized protein n=1 Tax=Colletotrichum sojae TaxID=2175907 RepID=A0A8H6J2E1_9PEZI|nr:hypothetical protein CSOJ01_09896 [Colletotrichum sojae]